MKSRRKLRCSPRVMAVPRTALVAICDDIRDCYFANWMRREIKTSFYQLGAVQSGHCNRPILDGDQALVA